MTSASPLRGIFTPNVVPLDTAGRIDERELRRYVDWLIQRGVHGLYPNGSTGEFTRFSPEERRRIVAIMTDQAAGRVPVLAGAAEANIDETLRAAEHYATLGVRAVAIVAPFYFRLGADALTAYFHEIAERTPIDVLLYNIPMLASPIEPATVIQLAKTCPRIIGIKDSSGDLPNMMRMIAAVRPQRSEFAFFTGWDAALLPMLLIGCDGGINASSGVVPEMTRQLYDLFCASRLDEARDVQYRLLKLFDPMLYDADFPEGFRVGLAARGFAVGPGRQPKSPELQAKLDRLAAKLRDLLAGEELAD